MSMPALTPDEIPFIDLSAFGPEGDLPSRSDTAAQLREACSTLGFVGLTGIGITRERIDDAFTWARKLFALPLEDKMKAPHPVDALPHRGYSSPGAEKVYSKEERDRDAAAGSTGKELRRIEDHKESYEVGSESNVFQPNIWLPDSILPHYKEFALSLYDDLHNATLRILSALSQALQLSSADEEYLRSLHTGQNNQLRLLHYPEVDVDKLMTGALCRMPAHQDWSTFTILFQDSVGGLELMDPRSGAYVAAKPLESPACVLNVGDMLTRFSNGLFPSAMHRVTFPPIVNKMDGQGNVTKERYSIPYFVAPDYEAVVGVLPSLLKEEPKFEKVRWCDYGEYMWKHAYK